MYYVVVNFHVKRSEIHVPSHHNHCSWISRLVATSHQLCIISKHYCHGVLYSWVSISQNIYIIKLYARRMGWGSIIIIILSLPNDE